eukprot:gb/GEZN01006312.1/.p1 GENE.gb/GEZN01006312.1/~~gb/GEZN01006312.1/.p1  ORF type:complete len:391 (+),score=51.12 gb/GEZN01006312.1/:237-1409(+)
MSFLGALVFGSLASAKFVPGVDIPATIRQLAAKVASGQWDHARTITDEQRAALPTDFDSASYFYECADIINDIRDQSNCGCCWAFAAAEAASDRLCIATKGKIQVPLSTRELCFCASSNGCGGGTLIQPWEYILHKGLVTGAGQGNGTFDQGGYCLNFGRPNQADNMPHCHHHGPIRHTCSTDESTSLFLDMYPEEGSRGCPVQESLTCPDTCDEYSESPNQDFSNNKYTFNGRLVVQPADADTIAMAIFLGGPVEAAFTVYEDFENYTCGIYYANAGAKSMGGHAIKIVGWGEENGQKYWKCANSWNPTWGESGYFRIRKGVNECGIESLVTSSNPSAVWVVPGGKEYAPSKTIQARVRYFDLLSGATLTDRKVHQQLDRLSASALAFK